MDKSTLSQETRLALLELQMEELKKAQDGVEQKLARLETVLNRFLGALLLAQLVFPLLFKYVLK